MARSTASAPGAPPPPGGEAPPFGAPGARSEAPHLQPQSVPATFAECSDRRLASAFQFRQRRALRLDSAAQRRLVQRPQQLQHRGILGSGPPGPSAPPPGPPPAPPAPPRAPKALRPRDGGAPPAAPPAAASSTSPPAPLPAAPA